MGPVLFFMSHSCVPIHTSAPHVFSYSVQPDCVSGYLAFNRTNAADCTVPVRVVAPQSGLPDVCFISFLPKLFDLLVFLDFSLSLSNNAVIS